MKNGKKPTRAQRKWIERSKLSASEWLVERETSTEMVLVHRFTKTTKTIWK